MLPGPFSNELDPGFSAMFTQAGEAPPQQVTRCDAMAAISLVRQSDAITLMPAPLLAQPECQGLVELLCPTLKAPPIDLLLLTPPEAPLTPAARYLARCLTDAILAKANT